MLFTTPFHFNLVDPRVADRVPSQSSVVKIHTEFAQPELEALYRVMNDLLLVRTHQDLLRWLHGGVQDFIPHEILIAAWGDFKLGLVQLDVTSHLIRRAFLGSFVLEIEGSNRVAKVRRVK